MNRKYRYTDRKGKNLFRLLCLGAVLLTVIVGYFTCFFNPNLVISYIDVGQGDAVYIRTPDNVRVLLDGGDEGSFEKVLSSFFVKNGVPKLDAAIVSHYHTDHASGIKEAMEYGFPIAKLYLPESENDSVLHGKLLDAAEKNGTTVQYLSGGDTFELSDGITFEVIMPNPEYRPIDKANENNNSLLMRLKYADNAFIFTGDLEADAELAVPDEIDIRSDVLKVGHHGSRSSTSQEFLDRVQPKFAVISCGENNKYKHPHSETVKRLNKNGIRIYRTDNSGTVTFEVNKDGKARVKTTRKE